MRKIVTCALLATLVACAVLHVPGGADLKGVDVKRVAEVLRAVADSVELYDVNKDGLITKDEVPPLGLAIGQKLYLEMQR